MVPIYIRLVWWTSLPTKYFFYYCFKYISLIYFCFFLWCPENICICSFLSVFFCFLIFFLRQGFDPGWPQIHNPTILLPHPPKRWDYTHDSPCPASFCLFKRIFLGKLSKIHQKQVKKCNEIQIPITQVPELSIFSYFYFICTIFWLKCIKLNPRTMSFCPLHLGALLKIQVFSYIPKYHHTY